MMSYKTGIQLVQWWLRGDSDKFFLGGLLRRGGGQRRCHQVVITWADSSKPSFQDDKAGVEGHEGRAVDKISHKEGRKKDMV